MTTKPERTNVIIPSYCEGLNIFKLTPSFRILSKQKNDVSIDFYDRNQIKETTEANSNIQMSEKVGKI